MDIERKKSFRLLSEFNSLLCEFKGNINGVIFWFPSPFGVQFSFIKEV